MHGSQIPQNKSSQSMLVLSAAWASVSVALLLIGAKFWVWRKTQSISLQASFLDSLLDGLISVGNMIAIRHAQRPADHDHRFGHGKVEAIAALIQSLVIFCSGIWLGIEATMRFLHPQPLHDVDVGIQVILFSTLATGALVLFQNYVVRVSKSLAIQADSTHYKMDFVINLGVLCSLYYGVRYGWLDSVMGLVIVVYILFSCYQVFIPALNILMDKELPDEIREQIRTLIVAHPGVCGMHDLRTRSSGNTYFIQAHVEMAPTLTLHEAHDISESIQNLVEREIPHSEVLIHIDPPY